MQKVIAIVRWMTSLRGALSSFSHMRAYGVVENIFDVYLANRPRVLQYSFDR